MTLNCIVRLKRITTFVMCLYFSDSFLCSIINAKESTNDHEKPTTSENIENSYHYLTLKEDNRSSHCHSGNMLLPISNFHYEHHADKYSILCKIIVILHIVSFSEMNG